MTTVTNNNLRMVDRPVWEQLTTAPVATAAGSCMVDDDVRYIYVLFNATNFWSYDTWKDTWIQLPSPPSGTVAAGTCMRYVRGMGGQAANGEVFGSVYAMQAAGASITFYRYDIATMAWSAILSIANVPAAFGTDGRLVYPEPGFNGWLGGYHNAFALNTVTAGAQANAGATSITVSALPLAMPAGAVLNFGTAASPIWAVLTAAAAAAATSITVAALNIAVPNAAVAYWYADMFLFGNNATAVYRYNIASNTWNTTSANSGTPAIPAVTAALGAGLIPVWLPGSGDANALDRIVIVRGTGTGTVYEYSLTGNSFSTVTYYPSNEVFTTGTSSGVRSTTTGLDSKLLIQSNATGRIFEFDRKRARLDGSSTQNLIAPGAAVVGDKSSVLKSPEGIEFLFTLLNTSTYFLRTPLF